VEPEGTRRAADPRRRQWSRTWCRGWKREGWGGICSGQGSGRVGRRASDRGARHPVAPHYFFWSACGRRLGFFLGRGKAERRSSGRAVTLNEPRLGGGARRGK
jgi:hypothetical protein